MKKDKEWVLPTPMDFFRYLEKQGLATLTVIKELNEKRQA